MNNIYNIYILYLYNIYLYIIYINIYNIYIYIYESIPTPRPVKFQPLLVPYYIFSTPSRYTFNSLSVYFQLPFGPFRSLLVPFGPFRSLLVPFGIFSPPFRSLSGYFHLPFGP